MKISANCYFERRYFYLMGESNGKFRGKGTITVDDESVIIKGKRVYPLIARLFIILFITIMPSLLFGTYSFILLLLIISSILAEYVILKEEKLSLKWNEVTKYIIEDKTKTIAFSSSLNSATSPVVLKSPEFENIVSAFRERIPDRESTSKGWKAVEERYNDQINTMAKFVDRLFK